VVNIKTDIIMKQFTGYLLLLLFITYCDSCLAQENQSQKATMIGSDIYISNNCCNDSCVIIYNNYTIITKTHKESLGEDIYVVYKNENLRLCVDKNNEHEAKYFNGLYGDKIIIDEGSGTIRNNLIFDLKQKKIIDLISSILDDSKINKGKLFYLTRMLAEKVKKLKLPICEDTGLENNGYFEEFYYDFDSRQIISTEKYTCVK
jgi:hypothetical protein